MKGLTRIAVAGGVILTAIGSILAATNPNQTAYETFATQQLTTYLDKNLCEQKAGEIGLRKQCKSLLESNQSQIRSLIADNTQRQNFFFFSLYTTDLSLISVLPSYHFETAGIFQQFHIYEAKQN